VKLGAEDALEPQENTGRNNSPQNDHQLCPNIFTTCLVKEMASWKERGFVPDSDDEESSNSDVDASEGRELEPPSAERDGNLEEENEHTLLGDQGVRYGSDGGRISSRRATVDEDTVEGDLSEGDLSEGHAAENAQGAKLAIPEIATVVEDTVEEDFDLPLRMSLPKVYTPRHLLGPRRLSKSLFRSGIPTMMRQKSRILPSKPKMSLT